MATKAKWTGPKVNDLYEAVKAKDIEAVKDLVAGVGAGAFPDKVYGRSYPRIGPEHIAAAALETDDPVYLGELLELSMPLVLDDWKRDSALYGETGNRNPEVLRVLAAAGFEFKRSHRNNNGSFVSFLRENRDDIELFNLLENNGMAYDYDSLLDEEAGQNVIPWQEFIESESFAFLEHAINIGLHPNEPIYAELIKWESQAVRMRKQAGRPVYREQDAEIGSNLSENSIAFCLENGFDSCVAVNKDDVLACKAHLISYFEKGIRPRNPAVIFQALDVDLINAFIQAGFEVSPECVDVVRQSRREDLMSLLSDVGCDTEDVTMEILSDIEDAFYRGISREAPLKIIDALKDGRKADWPAVTEALARLYANDFDPAGFCHRGKILDTLIGEFDWTKLFEGCLGRADCALEFDLAIPSFKVPAHCLNRKYLIEKQKAVGLSYWHESDSQVYAALCKRGVQLTCDLYTGYYFDESSAALPGDAFIWLEPAVRDIFFEQKGWTIEDLKDKKRLDKKYSMSSLENLDAMLVGSGNAAAYAWYLENDMADDRIKSLKLADVLETPLLRVFLEHAKDGSIRTTKSADFVRSTIKGAQRDVTPLLVKKLAPSSANTQSVRDILNAASEKKDRAEVAQQCLEILSERATAETKKKAPSKKPKKTVAQTITEVCDSLDRGDSTKLDLLEPIAAKVPMVDAVELLERASANCDARAIDRLYDLFAPFEYESGALLVALFSGNVSTSGALMSHGADLSGTTRFVDAKRTPEGKLPTRKKRYAHGLLGKKYSSGSRVAYLLEDALTKDSGLIAKRSDTQQFVNNAKPQQAADTLLAADCEISAKKEVADRLLWCLVSFDGRATSDQRKEFDAARKLFEAGMISDSEARSLPWDEVQVIGGAWWGWSIGETACFLELAHDFANTDAFAKCWRQKYAKLEGDPSPEEARIIELFAETFLVEPCPDQMQFLSALVKCGKSDTFIQFAELSGWMTDRRAKKLLEIANESGQTEILAWLVDYMGKNGPDNSKGLEL